MAKLLEIVALFITLSTVACTTGPNYPMPSAPTTVDAPVPPSTPQPTPTAAPMQMTMSVSPTGAKLGTPSNLSTWMTGGGAPVGAVAYQWTFGDGQVDTTTEGRVSHTYARAGTFEVKVTATDSTERRGEATNSVQVREGDPEPAPIPPAVPVVPTVAVTLTCTPAAPPGLTSCNVSTTYGSTPTAPSSVVWDFGDAPATTTTTRSMTHAYANAGTYAVFATASVPTVDGTRIGTASTSVVVPATTPTVPLYSNNGVGNTVFTIPATVTRLHITGIYAGATSNFVVTIANALVVNEIIGTGQTPPASDGTYQVSAGGTAAITQSSGVIWTFTEVR